MTQVPQLATPEQQAETRRRDEERRASAKAAKQLQRQTAEAGRLARKQEREERERANGNSVMKPVSKIKPVSETRAPHVVYVPTPEETEAFRATRMQKEKNQLEARRRAEHLAKAKQTKGTILELLKKQPGTAINILVQMAIDGGFEYSRDDNKAAVYVSMGVEIRIFGAAINPDGGKDRLHNGRLSEEQRKAAERRAKNREHNAQTKNPVQEQAQEAHIKQAEIGPEERAKIKADNIKKAAAAKAAKALKQAQYKATHPKKVKQPKQAPKKDSDGKTQKQVRK